MLTIDCSRKHRTRKYFLKFPYNIDFINKIKELPKSSRLWNGSLWEVEAISLMELIKSHKGSEEIFFDFGDVDKKTQFINVYNNALQDLLDKESKLDLLRKKQESSKELKKFLKDNYHLVDYSKYLNEGIKPYPHQIIGAKFINELNSCIVTADMGTGKTILSLLACEMKGEEWNKVFIIVPNSLKLNWRNEIEKFTSSKWYIIDNTFKKNKYTIEESKYIITNYEYFRSGGFSVQEKLIKKGIDPKDVKAIIFDEAHKLKNTKSNTYRNIIKSFKKRVKNYVLLSGTIMPNRLEELYVSLNLILPEEFSSKNKFYSEYCGLKYDMNYGWQVVETPDLERVFNKLDGVMYRVKKEDVLKDLPDISINLVNVEMNSKEEKEYKDIEDGFLNVDWNGNNILGLDNEGEENPLVILGRLRKYTSKVKIDVVAEFVESLNLQGEKVVIFDIFKDSLMILADRFKENSAYYGGSVSSERRQELIDTFQDPNSGLMNLFLTAQTGNAGITLTAASNMILISQSFVPGENEQMYARIHRIGAKNSCNVYIFAIDGTVDEKVFYLVKNKSKVISKVIDNADFTDNVKPSIVDDLLKSYKNNYKK
jgi:SNF2 family DNA or RNA helicase